jgi:phosphoribosylaminoimidazole-succinocarboxamide synthase
MDISPEASFDKQYLRNWLVADGFKKGWKVDLKDKGGRSRNLVKGTKERYEEVIKMLMS